MSIITDRKYVMMLGGKLERFRQKSDSLWTFRCPLCGDSKKDKTKTRGYIYRKKDNMFFHCHNCNESMFFGQFLKRIDVNMHRDYSFDNFSPKPRVSTNAETAQSNETKYKTQTGETLKSVKINLPSVLDLPFDHFAKKIILSRKIPEKYHSEIYYASCFRTFLDETLPDHGKPLLVGEKRLVFPFYDQKNIFLGLQGRAIFESPVKYITILSSENSTKIYGLSHVDLSKTIYVTEGPIDSMFLNNALATMDAGLYRIISLFGNYDYVFIYDNEKRNSQVVGNMKKTIQMGRKIFIWPRNIKEKDINDLAQAGMTDLDIHNLVQKNTYEGLNAELEMSRWSR